MNRFFLFSILLALFSCSNTRGDQSKKTSMDTCDKIVFHFQDASVPPPYHRSYSIEVTATESKVVVDSYGEVLADTTLAISEATWKNLLELTGDLQPEGKYIAEGATGTKGYNLVLSKAGKQLYSLYWDSLSTKKVKEGALKLKSAVTATVPNLSELTR